MVREGKEYMVKFLLLACGGALGTLFRYALSGMTYRALDGIYPWGTLAVNLAGCLTIGFLWGFSEIENFSPNVRSFIFIGFLGGFTTFSTFALESFNLFRDEEVKVAVSNILVSNVFGIVLVFIGFFISKHLLNVLR
jgi:CrcB protein